MHLVPNLHEERWLKLKQYCFLLGVPRACLLLGDDPGVSWATGWPAQVVEAEQLAGRWSGLPH